MLEKVSKVTVIIWENLEFKNFIIIWGIISSKTFILFGEKFFFLFLFLFSQ